MSDRTLTEARVARIAAYRDAYEAANGTPVPAVHYQNGWYYIGRISRTNAMRFDALERATERLLARATPPAEPQGEE